VIKEANRITQEIDVIKEIILAPNNLKLMNAVTSFVNSVQIICFQIYRQMPYDMDNNLKVFSITENGLLFSLSLSFSRSLSPSLSPFSISQSLSHKYKHMLCVIQRKIN
jgi:hypothetical protein